MEVYSIFLCYSVFLLINYFFSKNILLLFFTLQIYFQQNTLWSIARGRLRNYKTDKQGEEKGMSGAKASIRKDRRKKNCCLLPDDLALPDANCFVIYQGTIRIVLSAKRSKQLCVVWPRNSTLPIFLCIIPVLNLIFKRNPPLLRKVPH